MFRLGIRSQDTEGECVTLVAAQGSHKVKPLLQADCWVIFPGSRTEVKRRRYTQYFAAAPNLFWNRMKMDTVMTSSDRLPPLIHELDDLNVHRWIDCDMLNTFPH
jgi:hypothetical protein